MATVFSLGVSPGTITTPPIMRGDTYIQGFLVSTTSAEMVQVLVETRANEKLDWVRRVGDEKIEIKIGEPQYVDFLITPHMRVNVSDYLVHITFATIPTKIVEGTGMGIAEAVEARMTIVVAEQTKISWFVIFLLILPIIIIIILFVLGKMYPRKRDERKRKEWGRKERSRISREKKKVQEMLKKTMGEGMITVEEVPKKKKISVQEKIKKTLGLEKPVSGIEEIVEEVEEDKEKLMEQMEEELSGTKEPIVVEEIVTEKVVKKPVKKKKDDLGDLEKQLEDQLKLIEKTKKEIEKKLKK